MKANLFSRCILLFFAFTFMSLSEPYSIKRVSDKDFRYEFYTTVKKTFPKENKTYYWFKGGLIHEAQGGIAGDLLNDKFIKMYHNNQLAEQGEFKNGLKIGVWKTWYQNGILATTQIWSNGLRSGKYFKYNDNGILIEKGKFSSNLKTGTWTNNETKEITTYRKGMVVKGKEIFTKSEKYRIKQEAIKLENTKKVKKELEASSDATKLASYKAKAKEEKEFAREKNKKDREAEVTTKKTAREAKKEAQLNAKNEPKKDSKIEIFFKNIFKKKKASK